MKKNALGIIALAMAFMGNVAMAVTQDTKGAIRSIDRCTEYGVVLPAGTIETSLTVGEKAYFRIRLENHNSQAIWKSWNTTHTNQTNPWYFWDTFSGSLISPVQAGIKVGVFVSGRFTYADVIDVITDIRSIDPNDGGGPWFTDLLCSYTVQPGDLALPLTLANSNRDEATASNTTAYFVGMGSNPLNDYSTVQLRSKVHNEDPGYWDDITDTRTCTFKFGDYNTWGEGTEDALNAGARTFAKTSSGNDYTLFNAGIFIKSIDFDNNFDDEANGVWRAVHERSTSTKEFVPSLLIPGEVAEDYAGSVYLWSADENSVMLPDATISVNGTKVQKLTFDGSPASLRFRLRGVTQGTQTEIFLSSTLTNVVSGSGRTITNFVSRTVTCIAPLAPGVNVLANGAPTLQLNATADYTNSVPFKVELTQAWTNDEPVTVKFKYYLTNSTVAVSAADLSKLALIALSDDQQFGYDSILPDAVTIPAGETDSIELDTNVRALYALGALTGSNKGDKITIEPYFENASMATFFSDKKPLTLSIYGMKPNILTINNFATDDEKITTASTNSALVVRGGVPSEFEVRVSDTYRNMQALDGSNGSFTITWQYEGGTKITITNDVNGAALIPDGDGVLHVSVKYPVPTADQNMYTTVKVKNADGRESEKYFYVFVKQPKNVTAALESAVVGEGAKARVTFTLSETSSSSSLYAFLEPANVTASNLSYAAFFTTNTVEAATRGVGGEGVPFTPGNLVAVSDALLSGNGLQFFDNSSEPFVYNIRLSSSPTWNPDTRVTEFIENQLILSVTNNFPVITQVMAKNNVTGLDKLTTSTIVMNLTDPMRTFRVSVLKDVDLDKNGVGSDQVVYAWEAYKYDETINAYRSSPDLVFYKVGLNSSLNMEEMFGTTLTEDFCGLYRFKVRAQDKDMRGNKPQYLFNEGGEWKYNPWRGLDMGGAVPPAYPEGDSLDPGNDWGEAYVFELLINKNPYVDASPFNESASDNDGTPIFRESDLLAGTPMGFWIRFNEKPGVSGFLGVSVAVTITAVDAYGNDIDFSNYSDGVPPYVAPKVSLTNFSFTATVWSNKFTFADFDGTWWGPGLTKKGLRYRLVAAVTSTSASPSGTPWNELYTPATNYFRLENSAPVVTIDEQYAGQNTETNAMLGVPLSPNQHINFRWAVSDVPSDLSQNYTDAQVAALGPTNLIVTCKALDGGYEIGSVTNEDNGTFSVWFEKPGIQRLQITATDKDGDVGYSQIVYFYVLTSKNVFLYPYGPSTGAGSDEIAKYFGKSGLGVGRVWCDWTDGGGFSSIKAYVHTWTFGKVLRTARVFGEGYSAWQRDTSTAAGKSIAPKQDGSGVGEGDERYVNTSDFDSFFYRWFKLEPGKSGSSGSSDAEWTGVSPTPSKGGDEALTLPVEEANYSYADSAALAVFSREKYLADNMGDINGDGIPDVFAVKGWTSDAGEEKPLYVLVNGGDSGGGEDGSINDLVDLSSFNDDLDFLPVAASQDNPLKPTVFDWGPGVKFDALYEIRGIGLSETSNKEKAHLGLNEPGISDYDLSVAERYALFADYAAAGNVLTGVLDNDYIAATNWATGIQWMPEVWRLGAVGGAGERLNPAKADTDGDGMDDGWEYYFWYYAKVGAVTNGVWGRLEGRRYDLAFPATGTRISPAEIVEQFNPLERNEFGDFDNDGLTDLEEYALGTNPIDWDSDGDGMNDLWEVMNGLDPLSLDDDPEVLEYDSTADVNNMDRDFMARCTYDDDTFTVFTFANGEMYGLPTKSSPSFDADPVETATNVYELVVVDSAGVTNTYYTVEPAEYDDSADPHALTADAVAFETIKVGDTVHLKSMETITLPTGTTSVLSAAGADEAVTVTLASLYYGADKVINSELKTVKIWFAEKPTVIYQLRTGLLQLAADAPGFTTYEHEKDVFYLGEATVFPAGTLLKAVAATPEHMTPVNTPPYIETPFGAIGGFNWRNPETLETEATGKALPLFNYGGDGATYVPCSQKADHFALAPVVEDTDRKLTRSAVVKVERKHKITLIHSQVLNQYGFDPRTAWNIDNDGYVGSRWHDEESEGAGSKGAAGKATRTVPYNSRDEYLVMQYRQQMRAINDDGTRSYTTTDGTAQSLLNGGNRYLLAKGAKDRPGSVSDFRSNTTYPNFPVNFVRELYQSRSEVNPFDNSTNRTIVTYWTWLEQEHKIHGADTDYDGVPDGWELYVNADPNNNADAKEMDGWANDGDKLNFLKEYAGVDSCNAYTNRFGGENKVIYPEAETITENHPGKKSGWWNKFFPTNPYDKDTDGDGLKDDAEEASSWKGAFYVGQTLYGSQDFSFIYGCKSGDANFEKYSADGKTICFRGGGLNPCTVDTDGDLLPDAWEYQFAGVLFMDGEPVKWTPRINSATEAKNDLDLLKMSDGGHTWGKQNACSSEGYEIRGGMDGTYGYYNDSPHDGDASMDFDHDGLANCQEYLVQSLRHLRYDDPYTPLMGIHPGTKQFLKFIPFSAWDGEAFHKRCLAAGFTGLGTWKFSELGYFTLPPHKWDPLYLNTSGQNTCKNYSGSEGAGYRIMLPPVTFTAAGAYTGGNSMRYATTDPRRWDSDEDGMDDYYELFHGLNPLLGSAGCPDGRDEYDVPNTRFDVISEVHGGFVTSWRNHWTDWPIDRVQPALDAIRFPWMMGTMECDADGDGLRNDEESLKVNLAKPSVVHTDPTPLWMTDSSGLASYTAQYYNPDPYITEVADYDPLYSYPDVFAFPWDELTWYIAVKGPGVSGATRTWMFSFEENEGYDTDHDFKRDTVELSGLPTNGTFKVEVPSDPKVFCDPDRRQALYFPGDNSAAASRDGKITRAVSDEPDLLKQFTVELWVKPDGFVSNAVIVERVFNYGPSTLTYSNAVMRANFRLGVDENGHAYGEYEGSTENSGGVRVTAPSALPVDTWTHLALTYSGADDVISLYVNGEVSPVDKALGAGMIPANGIMGIRQEYYATVIPYGYVTLPGMTVFGAHAKNGAALALDQTTQWEDFGSFFKGWVDEVRVWDGARTPSEIHASYRKRFTMADIKLMRSRDDDSGIQGFYEQWFDWTTKQKRDPLQRASLPAELLQHYSFASLPGGVGPTNVLTEPVEFQNNVLRNVCKPGGGTLKTSLKVGWWSKTPVRSTVYTSNYVIPWIGNTVAHLPFLDGSAPDSQYWSEKLAGVMKPEDQSFTSYDFPNEANPYPYYIYRRERFNRRLLLEAVEDTDTENVTNLTGVTSSSLAWKWRFQMRSEFLGTSDLVPLGGAYARRDTDFWDGQGAMDAWTETSKARETADVNGNGIPDWAEALWKKWCQDNNRPVTDLEVDEYLRALAKGLLPSSASWDDYDPAFVDATDLRRDGVKDWWQKMYGLTGSAHNDTDQDGLPDFAEYLVSEVFKFGEISPVLAKSNSTEFDYFRKVGRLYLGELFCDHDHMEDGFEREWAEIGADPAYYDAHLDSDEDGWSNWSEVRAKCDMGLGVAELDTSVTNVFYYVIPREDYGGYACYEDFKAMANALNDLQTQGELIVEDAQFTKVGFGHTYVQDSVRGLPGCPSGKNGEFHTDSYGTGWFRVRFISKPYGITWRYRGHPTPEVNMTIHYNGIEDLVGRSLQVSAYTDSELKQADATFTVLNTRMTKVGANRNVNTLSFLTPDSGYLREGKNTFVVTVSASNVTESASTSVKPEIIGVARDVDVGWNKVEFDIELLEESPGRPRPELTYSLEGENTDSTSSSNNGSQEAGTSTSHVYVYRYSVDGYTPPSSLVNRLVLDKDIGYRTYLHEGDFLADRVYDIDWTDFQDEVVMDPTIYANESPVTSVTYRVYSQPVSISEEAASNAVPFVEFVKIFDETQRVAVPVSPGENSSIIYKARPTFRWRMDSDTYTAFAIQVLDAAGKPIWNSGTQLAPPRNGDGDYEWQAPLYPGDQTDLGMVFANTNNYKWHVTMYNAKFQSAAWSEARSFRMNVYAEDEVNIADTYGIKVAVKYFGPGTVNTDAATKKGTLRVEAYTSPDFSGLPAGRTFVQDLTSVTDTNHTVNAKIVGLKSGKYYVRAYIDSDGDFKRADWESWGYACPIGDVVTGSIFAPTAVTIGEGVEPPSIQVYVEDCDTDQDCLPDVWEYNEANGAANFLARKGPMTDNYNGYISVNPNLESAISDLINGGNSLWLMSAGPRQMPKALAALMLGTDSVDPSIDAKTLSIKSLALADGKVTIALAAEAEDPAAGTVFVTDGMVRVTVVVKYADSLSGEWDSVEKYLEKKIEDGAVSEELTFSLEELGLDATKGFFKVEVKQ